MASTMTHMRTTSDMVGFLKTNAYFSDVSDLTSRVASAATRHLPTLQVTARPLTEEEMLMLAEEGLFGVPGAVPAIYNPELRAHKSVGEEPDEQLVDMVKRHAVKFQAQVVAATGDRHYHATHF
eukprot:comp19342_c0_seq1/m.22265 comp19342_c0_seq1/g.22265  ORF comp19342_c0_seq1/g.22265 comp19342_c0_seq1/m.22265 type:complete len:124 (-) comp19342_c0_seq1:811-1182(-)